MRNLFHLILAVGLLVSCSPLKQISKTAERDIVNADVFKMAHVGITVFDPSTSEYIYDYQGDKFFVPASNTKIPTAYAAMKYLGDSLVAGRLAFEKIEDDTILVLYPSGDPSFLHPDFNFQPLYEKLKNRVQLKVDLTAWESQHWGNGWSWNDFDQGYMAERFALPMYGGLYNIYLSGDTLKSIPELSSKAWQVDPDLDFDFQSRKISPPRFSIERALNENLFQLTGTSSSFRSARFPIRYNWEDVEEFLEDTLRIKNVYPAVGFKTSVYEPSIMTVYSQPTDSVLKPMMHRSDNFFAEQSLLMVSNELFGKMNEAMVIDSIMKSDFKDLPQRPRWVDGSGLSRYNLFTPQGMVAILNKMKAEFGMERIQEVFPSGGEGTLSNYYQNLSGRIYAKTGTLSGVVALSGFLYTRSNKLLIFSVLINNHRSSATDIRRGVEKFLQYLASSN